MRLSRDGIAGLVILSASLVLFYLTLGLKASGLVPIGPGFYPRIVLGITAFFSLWLVVDDVLAQRRAAMSAPAASSPGSKSAAERPNYTLVALNFALFGAYVIVLPGLGYRIATLLYVVIANALLSPPRGARGWAVTLALAIGTAFISHWIFEKELSVLLPRGRWTGF